MESTSTKDKAFFFERVKNDLSLSTAANRAIAFSKLSERMVEELRTRVWHVSGELENNAEHSFMLAKVAPMLTELLLPDLDHDLVCRFAILHDDIEAYVGDTPTDRIDLAGRLRKQALEHRGLEKLVFDFSEDGSYADLMQRYEAQIEPEARAVRMIDKLMPQLISICSNAEVAVRKRQSASDIRLNAKEESERLRADYGHDMGVIIDLRDELAEHIARTLDARPDQYLF